MIMENTPTPQTPGWRPTTSTASAVVIGGLVAQLIVWTLAQFDVTMDAQTATALGSLLAAGFSYIHPDGGRK